MSFFQNPFAQEFVGCLVLGDRQLSLNFRIKGNPNGVERFFTSANAEPYNVSTNKNFTLNYSADSGKSWTVLVIDVSTSAANTSAALASEIALALNNNATFNTLYIAGVTTDKSANYVTIQAVRRRENWKTYFSNTSAESVLRFNKQAGVAELPTYFARHTIANINTYTDSLGMLVQLDTSQPVDQQIITDAGLNYSVVQADWQLLKGRSGIFTFQKMTVDGSDRITQIIEYPAGAIAGDFARKTTYQYTGANTHPSQVAEAPYVLTSGDLITP